eukprot:c27230_g1_i1.p1 GENE.c27230_g1_i1~~c27230_g1_i1.p1  ORF type:complete len:232 (-),score=53.00 c27230_g1_i1:87-782(-)
MGFCSHIERPLCYIAMLACRVLCRAGQFVATKYCPPSLFVNSPSYSASVSHFRAFSSGCCQGKTSCDGGGHTAPATESTPHKHEHKQEGSGCCGGGGHQTTDTTQAKVFDDPAFEPSPGPLSDAIKMTQRQMLCLYKEMLQNGMKMPTQNRRDFIRDRLRAGFKQHSQLTDERDIDLQRRLALTVAEAIKTQQEHLNKLFASDIAQIVQWQKEQKHKAELEGVYPSNYFGN